MGRMSTSQPGGGEAARSLGDLRRAQPGDATLRNLLSLLNAKLELCSTLPVYEWEATNEGWVERAAGFRSIAETERRSCGELIEHLRAHLEQRAKQGSA
jgi:hypothetical protein